MRPLPLFWCFNIVYIIGVSILYIYNKVYVKYVTILKRIRVIFLKFVTLCPKSVKKWSKIMENSRNMTRNALFFAFSFKIVWLLNLFSINLHRFL